GLSPDEFSRPLRRQSSAAIRLPPLEQTRQLELAPDVVAKANGANGAGRPGSRPGDLGERPPTAATVKWEPPTEFQARLADGSRPSGIMDRAPAAPESRSKLPPVDATIDDLTLDAQQQAAMTPSAPSVPRTVPGDA